jgi:cell division protein ZapA
MIVDDQLKIKVNIAQRVYPLTIARNEEERVRQAVALIQDAVSRFEEKYAVQDKQDALAMCALQMTNQVLALRSGEQNSESETVKTLEILNNRLAEALR